MRGRDRVERAAPRLGRNQTSRPKVSGTRGTRQLGRTLGDGAIRVGQQFSAQDRQYRATHPDARFQIVNPAKPLYERFGFRRRETGLVYEFMERPAARSQLKAASY